MYSYLVWIWDKMKSSLANQKPIYFVSVAYESPYYQKDIFKEKRVVAW